MNLRPLALISTSALAIATALPGATMAAPAVVTDILPVQSIAARVMEGAGTPGLIVPPGASPHGYAMRPSEAQLLQSADVVFWIGEGLSPWLEGPLEALADNAKVVELTDAPGMRLLPFRTGALFEPHSHDADEGDVHDHAPDNHDHDHDHAEEHDDHGHNHGDVDPHVWLDPENAIAMAQEMADTLAAADAGNADLYQANAAAFADEMKAVETEISAELAALSGQHFIVFHDAFHYFEARFDFEASGAISLSDATKPSAARIAQIRDTIATNEIACVFAEPQFDDALIHTVTEGTGAASGTLDPLGSRLEPGATLYPQLLENIADNLTECLTAD